MLVADTLVEVQSRTLGAGRMGETYRIDDVRTKFEEIFPIALEQPMYLSLSVF